jgi:hypothetical protein
VDKHEALLEQFAALKTNEQSMVSVLIIMRDGS